MLFQDEKRKLRRGTLRNFVFFVILCIFQMDHFSNFHFLMFFCGEMLLASYEFALDLQRIDDSSRSDSSCMTMIYHIDYMNAYASNRFDFKQLKNSC